jgi:protein-tyrosine-phosphatase/DNA-binding transcriptional ArsR family regulator
MAARGRSGVIAPTFLELAGHTLRWRLMSELARSDRRVRELVALVDQPQSLVSYHLGRLRAPNAALVTTRRSSADGRDSYYSLDVARCAELLGAAGGALHPALGLAATPPPAATTRAGRRTRVLFLCSGNSARSQIAEALVQHLSNGTVVAYSAGSDPKPVRPNAIRVGHEYGIDLSSRRSKQLSRFVQRRFDFVISLCDRVREVCPEFPRAAEVVHWSVPDPSREGGTDDESYPAFQRVAAELEQRIHYWLLAIQSPNPGGHPA